MEIPNDSLPRMQKQYTETQVFTLISSDRNNLTPYEILVTLNQWGMHISKLAGAVYVVSIWKKSIVVIMWNIDFIESE